jgi:hypothetical protein
VCRPSRRAAGVALGPSECNRKDGLSTATDMVALGPQAKRRETEKRHVRAETRKSLRKLAKRRDAKTGLRDIRVNNWGVPAQESRRAYVCASLQRNSENLCPLAESGRLATRCVHVHPRLR